MGHEKCGTTALYRILKGHPEIFLPERKEPRFFADDRGHLPATREQHARITLDDYLSLFAAAGADQRAGDASPQYIRTPTAASEIAALAPHARIVAIVREPVAFVRSYHLACLRAGIEDQRDLSKALALEDERRRGHRIPRDCAAPMRLLYSDHVRYVEQLRRYDEALSQEQVLTLIYDDFRRDNEACAREVLRFLGVDQDAPLVLLDSHGQARKAVRSTRLSSFARAVKRARRGADSSSKLLRVLDAAVPARLDAVARRVLYVPTPPLDERLEAELRRRFKPHVVALSERLDRDLVALWGYDRIS